MVFRQIFINYNSNWKDVCSARTNRQAPLPEREEKSFQKGLFLLFLQKKKTKVHFPLGNILTCDANEQVFDFFFFLSFHPYVASQDTE